MKLKTFGLTISLLWGLFNVSFGGQLTSVTVSPGNNGAGLSTIYSINFTTESILPADGKIFIIMPGGFGLSSAELVQAIDPGVLDGGFSVDVTDDTIKISRDNTGTQLPAAANAGVKVAIIENHQTAGSYAVTVVTRLNNGSL
ncbi:MAG: hypothetical protein SCK70_12350, partial [bacterium]|nr:hypothetical protein [bacterium]